MAEYDDREHFIPLRAASWSTCSAPTRTSGRGQGTVPPILPAGDGHLHFEYNHILEQLKDAYAPFDPDSDASP